ncbi:MAG TPA: RNA-binding S4 domain-containing protein [Gemmatimonadaceae bacterium]|nr:RNA-binding S4 domain-containing protein [Gemmatimonadaceae bacterium]
MMNPEKETEGENPTRVRIDKWLWAARFYKTRGLSAEAIDAGKIEVNGDRAKRSRLVQAGDRIRIRSGPYEHIIQVKAVTSARGSAAIAQALYEEEAESRKAREATAAHVRAMSGGRGYEAGKPTKKDRREIDRMRRRSQT